MIKAIFLFILAGLAEIGGGYLIWQWLREGWIPWIVGGVMVGTTILMREPITAPAVRYDRQPVPAGSRRSR